MSIATRDLSGNSPSNLVAIRAEANRLAELEFRVFPIEFMDKKPRTRTGCKAATCDRKRIKAWKWESAHIGIAAGDGLLVIDVDGREGIDTIRGLESELGELPTTVTANSGRDDGLHLYFDVPFDVRNAAGAVGPGVDLRSQGGYVVAPPSTHDSGSQYIWMHDPSDFEVARLPDAWVEFLEHLRAAPSASGAGRLPGILTGMISGDIRVGKPTDGAFFSDEEIETIVSSHLPPGPGTRHTSIFQLVRALHSKSGVREQGAEAFADLLKQWYHRAEPIIRTKDIHESWDDFSYAWEFSRVPEGESVLAAAWKFSLGEPTPNCVRHYEFLGDPRLVNLAKLCRTLHTMSEGPFFLGGIAAGKVLDVGQPTASRWLRRLCRDRVLELVAIGSRTKRKASEYLYLGD